MQPLKSLQTLGLLCIFFVQVFGTISKIPVVDSSETEGADGFFSLFRPLKAAFAESFSMTPGEPHLRPSRRPGLVHNSNNCYMNSVITALFASIPFRSLVYSTTPPSTFVFFLAQLFGALQTGDKPIHLGSLFMNAFQRAYPDWEFGRFQCTLEFFTYLLDKLNVVQKDHLQLSFLTFRVLDTEASRAVYKRVVAGEADLSELAKFSTFETVANNPLQYIDTTFDSIQSAFDTGFVNEAFDAKIQTSILSKITGVNVEQDIVDKDEGPMAFAKVFNYNVPKECPNTLILGIQRALYGVEHFNTKKIVVNPKLRIVDQNGKVHMYALQSFAYFIGHQIHYVSYVCDYTENNGAGVWYRYDDSDVKVVDTEAEISRMYEMASTGATFFVYVREELVRQQAPEVPARYQRFINFGQNLFVSSGQQKMAAFQNGSDAPTFGHQPSSINPTAMDSAAVARCNENCSSEAKPVSKCSGPGNTNTLVLDNETLSFIDDIFNTPSLDNLDYDLFN